jgi:tetratricopeptide (TPR) repeat protein
MNGQLDTSTGDCAKTKIVQFMKAGDLSKSTLDYQKESDMYSQQGSITSQAKLMKMAQPQEEPKVMEPSMKLGVCLYEVARCKEAETMLTGCVEEASCDDDSAVAMDQQVAYAPALTTLASLYQAQSECDEERAIPLTRALEASQSSMGLADSIEGYAEALRKSGHLTEAEHYHREAQAIRTEQPCNKLELAISHTQLGCTFAAMGHHKKAYQQHHRALTMRYRFLEFSHGLVSESLNYCAESLCVLGRGEEGVPLALHAVDIRKSIFGVSHPAYAHALSVLSSCYHAMGRHFDARDCLVECLGICEHTFPKGHANMIPYLINYGEVLRSTGDLKQAKSVYERAISIHELNFKEGQKALQLQKSNAEVDDLTERMDSSTLPKVVRSLTFSSTETSRRGSCSSMKSSVTDCSASLWHETESKGTPVIVFTDIGRDVDDEMALVVLSALKRKRLLNPIAVITTLSPVKDRANLARGSLDTMGLAAVPVGIGGRGGVADGVDLEVYEADHARSSASIAESGMELACQALESVPSNSAQIICLASLSDMATLIRDHQELFTSKVKEVVVMGGVMPMDSSETLTPDTAYNNNCDMESANYVYQRCQELGVPTATLSRWAAYGCPIRPKLMDELAKTKHMVAANIRRKSKHSLDQLWNKVILPADHPGREKLPARCDVKWFYKTFCGTDQVPDQLPESIWSDVEKLNMYDPLAVLICVDSYRSLHFNCKTKTVNGVDHVVIGTCESDTGVKDEISLYKEYSHLFIEALQDALHEPEMPVGSEKAPDMLLEETTKIYNLRRLSTCLS